MNRLVLHHWEDQGQPIQGILTGSLDESYLSNEASGCGSQVKPGAHLPEGLTTEGIGWEKQQPQALGRERKYVFFFYDISLAIQAKGQDTKVQVSFKTLLITEKRLRVKSR